MIEAVPLAGGHVRLEPAREDDAEAMHAAATAQTFRWFTRPPLPWSVGACREYLRFLIQHPVTVPFSVFDARTGALIGGTTYCDIRPEHRGLEVGWTWIARAHRGTAVNPEMKLLMLRRAFETAILPTGSAIRVVLKTHHLNLHSQAAIRKLGAVYEGRMRNHVVMPDGSIRHTELFSIMAEEWPTVRAGLEARVTKTVHAGP